MRHEAYEHVVVSSGKWRCRWRQMEKCKYMHAYASVALALAVPAYKSYNRPRNGTRTGPKVHQCAPPKFATAPSPRETNP